MQLSEIYQIAEKIAPKSLSDELCTRFGFYDNSGILVNAGEEITGIVFALDLSFAAIEKAIAACANLMITHHPVIYGKIGSIDGEDRGLGEKLVRCIRAGISVLSMHLNLDACAGGIDECLQEGVCQAAGDVHAKTQALCYSLNGGGYGRVYEVQKTSLNALATRMKEVFRTERIEVYGQGEVGKIASFCGAGADETSVAFAQSQGARLLISSDFKHHILSLALESGLSVLTLTHYAAENYGFEKYYKKISQKVNVPCVYHEETQLL